MHADMAPSSPRRALRSRTIDSNTVMQAYYRHIIACNPPLDEAFLPWRLDRELVGWVRTAFVEQLQDFADVFEFAADEVRLAARLDHPNILGLKTADYIDGQLVIAFPLGQE